MLKQANLWLFFLCAGIVFLIQYVTLQSVIQYKIFDIQDWRYLLIYKSLDPNPFSQLINAWTHIGLHEASQVYHIGILSEFFGFNYQAYQITNILFKIAATLSFFPLILTVFQNRLLAFLGTLLFAINSATAGSFLVIAIGEQFLAVAFLNISLTIYYYVVLKNSKSLLLLSGFFFLLTFLLAPPRMFPLLLLIPLIEIYWLLTTKKFQNIKFSILRIIIYLLPIILISLPAPVSVSSPFTTQPSLLFKDIVSGNWHNLLDPFAGVGWMLVTNDFWKFLGTLEASTLKNFSSYLDFLFSGPLLVFTVVTLILSLILAKKPVRFFLLTFGLNFVAEILMFFVANDNYHIFENILKIDRLGNFIITSAPNGLALDNPVHFIYTKYPAILGIYILIVTFMAFLEWRKNKENRLLQALWAGAIFAVIFHFPGWMIQGYLINDFSSVHRYYLVPTIGISLFLAAILTLFYNKLKRDILLKFFATLIIFIIVFILLKANQSAIEGEYLGINNPQRIKITDQQRLHEKFADKLGDSLGNDDVLFYFDLSSRNLGKSQQYYKEALVVSDLGYWIKFRKKELLHSCVGAITDLKTLRASLKLIDGQLNFIFPGQCYGQNKVIRIVNDPNHIYKPENLRAFKIENGEFIDIKEQLLKELGNLKSF